MSDEALREAVAELARKWEQQEHWAVHRHTAAQALRRLLADPPMEVSPGAGAALRMAKAEAWDEARAAKPQYLGPDDGHYPDDCMGWEDCHCASYPNPYRDERQA